MAWSLRYLYDSFSRDLPWKYCSNKWNSECCNEKLLYGTAYLTNTSSPNPSNKAPLVSIKNASVFANCSKFSDPITEYWEYIDEEIIQISAL